MQTHTPSAVEMEAHIARFARMKPKSRRYAEEAGIPAEAFEMIAAKNIFLLMASEGAGGANAPRACRRCTAMAPVSSSPAERKPPTGLSH